MSSLVRETPLLPASALGLGVFAKLECLQRTGSFKLRGAVRAIAALPAAERGRGVVAASAGNHGAGLALAGRAAGVAVSVVVPRGTPAVKIGRMRALGAELVVDGATYDDSEAIARQLAAERGARFVSPFDDQDVIAGNGGDLAAELLRQRPDVARIVVPVGGGGLIGGLAGALGPRGIDVVGAEPAANCAMHDSLARGAALTEYGGGETCAEGLAGAIAQRTFELVRDRAAGIALVDEAAIRDAVRSCYRELGIVAECSAAVAIAALVTGAIEPATSGATVVVVTGGNIDDDQLDAILA